MISKSSYLHDGRFLVPSRLCFQFLITRWSWKYWWFCVTLNWNTSLLQLNNLVRPTVMYFVSFHFPGIFITVPARVSSYSVSRIDKISRSPRVRFRVSVRLRRRDHPAATWCLGPLFWWIVPPTANPITPARNRLSCQMAGNLNDSEKHYHTKVIWPSSRHHLSWCSTDTGNTYECPVSPATLSQTSYTHTAPHVISLRGLVLGCGFLGGLHCGMDDGVV